MSAIRCPLICIGCIGFIGIHSFICIILWVVLLVAWIVVGGHRFQTCLLVVCLYRFVWVCIVRYWFSSNYMLFIDAIGVHWVVMFSTDLYRIYIGTYGFIEFHSLHLTFNAYLSVCFIDSKWIAKESAWWRHGVAEDDWWWRRWWWCW